MRVPQVIITLAPDGTLLMERGGLNGARSQTPITSLETIRRALASQLRNRESTIGTDGSPTISQVRHWERHLERVDHRTGTILQIYKPDPDCIWCIAHDLGIDTSERAHRRARAILREQRRISSRPFTMGDGSVTVRKVPARDRHIKSSTKQETLVMDFEDAFDDIDFTQAQDEEDQA